MFAPHRPLRRRMDHDGGAAAGGGARSHRRQDAARGRQQSASWKRCSTDFWFNHFNVFLDKGADRYLVTEYERDAIRPHVLGKFRDLLEATAKSPAMLFYLDNWQSRGAGRSAAGPRQGKRQARPE